MSRLKLVVLLFIFNSCNSNPKIPISNTLEIALGSNYRNYEKHLNNAYNGDSVSFRKLLLIDTIYNSAGYDHGWILLKLLERVGDQYYSNLLKTLTRQQINNVSQYLEASIQGNKNDEKLLDSYKLTNQILKENYKE